MVRASKKGKEKDKAILDEVGSGLIEFRDIDDYRGEGKE